MAGFSGLFNQSGRTPPIQANGTAQGGGGLQSLLSSLNGGNGASVDLVRLLTTALQEKTRTPQQPPVDPGSLINIAGPGRNLLEFAQGVQRPEVRNNPVGAALGDLLSQKREGVATRQADQNRGLKALIEDSRRKSFEKRDELNRSAAQKRVETQQAGADQRAKRVDDRVRDLADQARQAKLKKPSRATVLTSINAIEQALRDEGLESEVTSQQMRLAEGAIAEGFDVQKVISSLIDTISDPEIENEQKEETFFQAIQNFFNPKDALDTLIDEVGGPARNNR